MFHAQSDSTVISGYSWQKRERERDVWKSRKHDLSVAVLCPADCFGDVMDKAGMCQKYQTRHEPTFFCLLVKTEPSWLQNIGYEYGGGDSSVVRAPDSWSKGLLFESRQERRENCFLQGQPSVLTVISVTVPSPCYRNSTWKIPVILQVYRCTAKHTCTPRIALHEVHDCMVYTERAPRRQQFYMARGDSHASTKQRCKYTTSMDIQNAL